MRILFIYSTQKTIVPEKPLLGQEGIYHGISSIAGVLKQHNHECSLAVLDRANGKQNSEILRQKIEQFNPQIVAFTAVFSEFDFICETASQVKERFPYLFLIAGGVHITLNPDEKYLSLFDAICVGEGEMPVLELVQHLEIDKSINDIQNLWVKTPDGIVKNPTRPFLQNLDELPFPDREMWQEWILEPHTKPAVLLGRGCPFDCTYCSNHSLRKVSPGKYVRMRSPENILSEIRNLYEEYPDINEIQLEVETIVIDKDWLNNFCEQLEVFGKETGFKISFGTNLRIFPRMDVEFVFEQFKKANITLVTIGLESGSYRIRKEILHRDYSNELILKAAETAKSYGIAVALFNMVGLPTETPAEFAETLQMNRQIQPTFHATSIFFPYPGTKIAETCSRMNLLPERINTKDERQLAVLDLPGFSRKQIQKSFDSFHYQVYRKQKNKSVLRLLIYYSMGFLGHNFYANLKIALIRFLYRTKNRKMLSPRWFSIFQRS
ncbi:MAG: B12-binding domain-containing radical SAM protein [Candidatus Azobacteroides sp.]|nr:B12-binding domain-containing radical SAM protein [Candidatus Azobacteroides sp.]